MSLFFEPWRLNADGLVYRADGEEIVDPQGSTLLSEEERFYMRRIVACVNACEGLATEDLEKINQVIAPIRAALDEEGYASDPFSALRMARERRNRRLEMEQIVDRVRARYGQPPRSAENGAER